MKRMHRTVAGLLSAVLVLPAAAQDIEIARAGSQGSVPGPAANFSGSVRVDPLFAPKGPSPTSGAAVSFEPGARSAWHSHPAGQVLVVTSGVGRIQQWGGALQTIRPGDVVWTPPGVKHWHGAAPTTAMTHLAIQNAVDGRNVVWLEKVSEEVYRGGQAMR